MNKWIRTPIVHVVRTVPVVRPHHEYTAYAVDEVRFPLERQREVRRGTRDGDRDRDGRLSQNFRDELIGRVRAQRQIGMGKMLVLEELVDLDPPLERKRRNRTEGRGTTVRNRDVALPE